MLTAIRTGKATYHVSSETDESKVYIVSLEFRSCSCPHFQYRLAGTDKGICKHIIVAEEACAQETALKAKQVPDERLASLYFEHRERLEISGEIMAEILRRQDALEAERRLPRAERREDRLLRDAFA